MKNLQLLLIGCMLFIPTIHHATQPEANLTPEANAEIGNMPHPPLRRRNAATPSEMGTIVAQLLNEQRTNSSEEFPRTVITTRRASALPPTQQRRASLLLVFVATAAARRNSIPFIENYEEIDNGPNEDTASEYNGSNRSSIASVENLENLLRRASIASAGSHVSH